MVYQGPASEAADYFEKNFGLNCPQFFNPADFFMEITHHESKENVKRYPSYFQEYQIQMIPTVLQEIENQNMKLLQIFK